LTDWRGSVRPIDDAILIELSAALREAPGNFPYPSRVQLWPTKGKAARIEVVLTLDAPTRAAGFGAYVPAMSGRGAEPVAATRTSLDAMRLDRALVGVVGGQYSWSDKGGVVQVHDYGPEFASMTLEGPQEEKRLPSGLIQMDNCWPRVRIRGVNLDIVAGAMGWKRHFRVDLPGGDVGEVEYSSGGRDDPDDVSELAEATLDFELGMTGLVIEYTAKPADGRPLLADRITVPWEVLSVRSQIFARHQAAILASPGSSVEKRSLPSSSRAIAEATPYPARANGGHNSSGSKGGRFVLRVLGTLLLVFGFILFALVGGVAISSGSSMGSRDCYERPIPSGAVDSGNYIHSHHVGLFPLGLVCTFSMEDGSLFDQQPRWALTDWGIESIVVITLGFSTLAFARAKSRAKRNV
jgi:hypothetical protein